MVRTADTSRSTRPRVAVVGGSLGGLTAALWAADAGCDVDVHERSPVALRGRGAGIVLHPATVRYLVEKCGTDVAEISVGARAVRYLDPAGRVAAEQPCGFRFTSYDTLHRNLMHALGPDRYNPGRALTAIVQDGDGVDVGFACGYEERVDLLVCADGIRSTGRALLVGETAPGFAGYVAVRGTVGAAAGRDAIPGLDDAVTYHVQAGGGHLLTYPIPGRLLNWLWYRNVPDRAALDAALTDRGGVRRDVALGPGSMSDRAVRDLHDAAAALPPVLAELVRGTPAPFVQAVFDIAVPRMAVGRACLVGDAAFTCRPHVAAGSAKAAGDAVALGGALRAAGGDVAAALHRWEPERLRVGRAVAARSAAAGRRLQDGTWPVGTPLPFGLHRSGDSAFP